jgi:hypothetical protein
VALGTEVMVEENVGQIGDKITSEKTTSTISHGI